MPRFHVTLRLSIHAVFAVDAETAEQAMDLFEEKSVTSPTDPAMFAVDELGTALHVRLNSVSIHGAEPPPPAPRTYVRRMKRKA